MLSPNEISVCMHSTLRSTSATSGYPHCVGISACAVMFLLTVGRRPRTLSLKRSESYTFADKKEIKRRNIIELQRMSHEHVRLVGWLMLGCHL